MSEIIKIGKMATYREYDIFDMDDLIQQIMLSVQSKEEALATVNPVSYTHLSMNIMRCIRSGGVSVNASVENARLPRKSPFTRCIVILSLSLIHI